MTAERELVQNSVREGRKILDSMELSEMRRPYLVGEGLIIDRYDDFYGRVLYQGTATVIRLESLKCDSTIDTHVGSFCDTCLWPVNGSVFVEYDGKTVEVTKESPLVISSGAGYKLVAPSIGTIIFLTIYPRDRGFDVSTTRTGA